MSVTNIRKSPKAVLVLALLATATGYLPTLNAPLFSDDYIYLDASKQLSFTHYARLAFTPWSRDLILPFTRDFWRRSRSSTLNSCGLSLADTFFPTTSSTSRFT